MNNKRLSYAEQRNQESILGFFVSITIDVVKDSKKAYGSIFASAFVFCLILVLARNFGDALSTKDIHLELIENSLGIFLLVPPFVLAIIAMFPAFSQETKNALKRPDNSKEDRPLGAVFLNQFVFVVLWSLVILIHSLVSKLILEKYLNSEFLWAGICSDVNFGLWLMLIGGLTYEIFHSLKILYLLILREYY